MPISAARMGASDGIVTACEAMTISEVPTPRPKMAMTIGSSAPTSEPKASSSTISAAMKPSCSELPVLDCSVPSMSTPPSSTSSWEFAAICAVLTRFCTSASWMVVWFPLKVTVE
jgi:hypothetical protein